MQTRILTVIEVVVVFALTLYLTALLGASAIGAWERQLTHRFFLEYLIMIALPVLLLLVRRKSLADHGISLHHLRYQLDVAKIAFIAGAVGSVPLAFVDYKQWDGALVLAGVEVAVLLAVAWLLRDKPTYNERGVLLGLMWLAAALPAQATVGKAVSDFVYYLCFLGLGEEILFRGYIQSRLNTAFGRPFRFYGVPWGWGLVITAILFGAMHWLNLGSLIVGRWTPTPWWGFWTFFAAFVGGFVREKTGSIVAPTIMHGLPQAIFSAFTGA